MSDKQTLSIHYSQNMVIVVKPCVTSHEVTNEKVRYRDTLCFKCGEFFKTTFIERNFSGCPKTRFFKKSICLNCLDMEFFME